MKCYQSAFQFTLFMRLCITLHIFSTVLGSPEVTLLNIGQQITALSAGVPDDESSINADAPHDMLFIGTQNHLLAYNVEQNRDVFYKDVSCNVIKV